MNGRGDTNGMKGNPDILNHQGTKASFGSVGGGQSAPQAFGRQPMTGRENAGGPSATLAPWWFIKRRSAPGP
ncbi:hypothetical protein CWS72_00195 [Telmatospirillum siberiense]|uniref:Uncharacterized protein n=1 Tax=Telmatospirillum siberiense TaxID=382514 RepID=A0A2N3Q0X2_9PROT|nr:hypothetical protein CWS72_00195 [Telmatospirillum siberiense]